jgi:DNA-binding MarR family transcriptional regulator
MSTTTALPPTLTATSTAEHQAFLAVQALASAQAQQTTDLLKTAGLSAAQYNVLRMLRGAGEGRTCGEISAQLISRDPDVTRLLDRLEHAGLVNRSRERADRRVITTRIGGAGLTLLAALDAPMTELHARQFGHLGPERLVLLLSLLNEVQNPADRHPTDRPPVVDQPPVQESPAASSLQLLTSKEST